MVSYICTLQAQDEGAALATREIAASSGQGVRVSLPGQEHTVTVQELRIMSLSRFAALWTVICCLLILFCEKAPVAFQGTSLCCHSNRLHASSHADLLLCVNVGTDWIISGC